MSNKADAPTSKVLFENRQWRVTAYGLRSIEPAPTFKLSAERFLETNRAEFYDWPVQMAEKNWVDIEAFIEAFTRALSLHAGKLNEAADPAKLRASIAKARQQARPYKAGASFRQAR
jgi:hypothetical protein